jgi:hypothetical protein
MAAPPPYNPDSHPPLSNLASAPPLYSDGHSPVGKPTEVEVQPVGPDGKPGQKITIVVNTTGQGGVPQQQGMGVPSQSQPQQAQPQQQYYKPKEYYCGPLTILACAVLCVFTGCGCVMCFFPIDEKERRPDYP